MSNSSSRSDLAAFREDLALPGWGRLSLLGSGLLVLGSFRPWITLTVSDALASDAGVPATSTAGGLAGDGVATLAFAAVVTVTVLFVAARSDRGPGRRTAGLCLFSALTVMAVAYSLYDTAQRSQASLTGAETAGTATVDLHASLFVVGLGALVLAASGLVGLVRGGSER